jgi:hypothetical protein
MRFGNFKLQLQILAIFLAIFCPAFLVWMASDIMRQYASLQWPEVEGKVLAIRVKSWQDNDRVTKYFGRVAYTYQVEASIYTTDLTDLGPGVKRRDEAAARADVSKYHPGDKVPVYYDPKEPGVAVLEKGVPGIHQNLFVGLIMTSAVSVLASIFVVRSWLRAWQARKRR